MSVLDEPGLAALVARLHAQSQAQEAETRRYFSERAARGDLSWEGLDADAQLFMADKLVALDPTG